MVRQKYELVVGKRISPERQGGLHTPRRVALIWDGETGLPAAMQVSHRATTEDILGELGKAGVEARGLEDGTFEPGKLTQRFKILPGSSEGILHLVPWERKLEEGVKILSLRNNDAVVRVIEGVDDETLCRAASNLFGRKVQAISQDGDGVGEVLVMSVDVDSPGVLNVRGPRLKIVL